VKDEGSDQLQYPEWQKPVQEALLEFDPRQLQQRITVAENAIASRLRLLGGAPNGQGECQAIQDARRLLTMLRERQARLA
jgi:hypothetical protein